MMEIKTTMTFRYSHISKRKLLAKAGSNTLNSYKLHLMKMQYSCLLKKTKQVNVVKSRARTVESRHQYNATQMKSYTLLIHKPKPHFTLRAVVSVAFAG